jgi:hypothetical protein
MEIISTCAFTGATTHELALKVARYINETGCAIMLHLGPGRSITLSYPMPFERVQTILERDWLRGDAASTEK